jgi:large subunit ribosomal protein L33
MGQKGKAVLIRLLSEAGTGFFYTTRKNPQKTLHKLQFVKYDPVRPPAPRRARARAPRRRRRRADRRSPAAGRAPARALHGEEDAVGQEAMTTPPREPGARTFCRARAPRIEARI